MKKVICTLLIGCLLSTSGCAALAIGTGIVFLSSLDSAMKKDQARKARLRDEESRRRAIASRKKQTIEEQRRKFQKEVEEKQRQARLQKERKIQKDKKLQEEILQQEKRIAQRLKEAKERKRRKEIEEQKILLNKAKLAFEEIDNLINKTKWQYRNLHRVLSRVNAHDIDGLDWNMRKKMRISLGLYAWLCDKPEIAKEQFSIAKKYGVTNCQETYPSDFWTGGSIYLFNSIERN